MGNMYNNYDQNRLLSKIFKNSKSRLSLSKNLSYHVLSHIEILNPNFCFCFSQKEEWM